MWMDPRIAWCPPEQLGLAHDQWSRLWEVQLGVRNLQLQSSAPNMNSKQQEEVEFIPLEDNNWENKYPNNKQQNYQNQHFLKRKRENKASTFGLNHSSCVDKLRNGGMTPWKHPDKVYSSGTIGSVPPEWIIIHVHWNLALSYYCGNILSPVIATDCQEWCDNVNYNILMRSWHIN